MESQDFQKNAIFLTQNTMKTFRGGYLRTHIYLKVQLGYVLSIKV